MYKMGKTFNGTSYFWLLIQLDVVGLFVISFQEDYNKYVSPFVLSLQAL